DQFHNRLSKAIILDGFAMITPTKLNGREVLRLCTINPRTTEDDFRLTVEKMKTMAQDVLDKA
ncbi:MAG: decarboxylase, partial [Alphaproteobacteria bacterium]|nr:decarboxylase [Alphaproteobacteria bacterium]